MNLLGVALAPSLFWLWYFWKQDRETREGAGPMARAFLWGTLSVIPAVILELMFGNPGHVSSVFECFFVIGPAEELSKFAATWLAIRREPDFDEPSDGVVAAAAVALGFAFAENIGYFAGASGGLVLVRSILSVPGHVLFAVFYGAALGRARCLPDTSRGAIPFGIVMASATHGLFDALLFHVALNPLLFVAMFVALVWLLWRHYRKLASACAAEGRTLRAKQDVVFIDPENDRAPEFAAPDTAPPGSAAQLPRADMESPDTAPFRWRSMFASLFYGVVFFFATAIAWQIIVPEKYQAETSAHLGASCILAMIMGGLVSAYMSPGHTVRESAAGLALLGFLIGASGSGSLAAGGALALVLAFLGAFGGWLGEALQDATGSRPRPRRNPAGPSAPDATPGSSVL